MTREAGRPLDRGEEEPQRPLATAVEAIRLQVRVVGALVLREVRTRFGASKIGYLWALLEPLAHVAVLTIVYSAFMRRAPVGTSMVLFFVTGIIPYFIYDKTAQRLAGAITANRALLHLALVKNIDVIIARAILEVATMIIVFLFLLAGLYAAGLLNNIEIDVLRLALAVLLLWTLALGIGAINAVLNTLIKSWDNVIRMLTRPLYLLSGIFYMVETIPPPVSTYLLYNPILHGVEVFRSAFYPGYGRFSIDLDYLATCAFLSLIAGFAIERALRKRISATAS